MMMLINCNAMVIMQVVMIFNDLSDVLEMVRAIFRRKNFPEEDFDQLHGPEAIIMRRLKKRIEVDYPQHIPH